MNRPPLAYAGIGSQATPEEVQQKEEVIAKRLAANGFMLYTGAAPGSDMAFIRGSGGKHVAFLPWAGFNKEEFHGNWRLPEPAAFTIAAMVHPVWGELKASHKRLMARNSHQVLRENLATPVDFVLCWTKDGAESSEQRTRDTGGTGQAIDLASRLGIPVINLANPNALERLSKIVQQLTSDRGRAAA